MGHQRRGGGGALNHFGEDFREAGFQWTKELCEKDSDCDGIPNGVELGDPSCIWTPGKQPQFDVAITHPGFTDAERQATIDSCADFPGRTVTAGETNVSLTFPPYAVPSKRTTYAKYAFKVDNAKLGGANELMAIRFDPIIDNANVVHHMLLYACTDESQVEQYKAYPKEGPMNCGELVWAWAVGGGAFCTPMSGGNAIAGFKFKSSQPWFLLETHYESKRTRRYRRPYGRETTMTTNSGGIQEAAYLWVGLNPESSGVPAKRRRLSTLLSARTLKSPTKVSLLLRTRSTRTSSEEKCLPK